jgi:hypothetical protein
MIGSSAAHSVSDIPWNGPTGTVRSAAWTASTNQPDEAQRNKSTMHVFVQTAPRRGADGGSGRQRGQRGGHARTPSFCALKNQEIVASSKASGPRSHGEASSCDWGHGRDVNRAVR